MPETFARKKYFFVFCGIFLSLTVAMSVGAWLTYSAAVASRSSTPAAKMSGETTSTEAARPTRASYSTAQADGQSPSSSVSEAIHGMDGKTQTILRSADVSSR